MTEVNARHSANLYGSDVWVLGPQCPGLNPSPATSQLGDSGQGLGKESSSIRHLAEDMLYSRKVTERNTKEKWSQETEDC